VTAVVADFKHGLALWPGTREEAQERHASVRARCRALKALGDADRYLRVLEVGEGVDELEMAQMRGTGRIPRRVVARFRRGDFG